MRIIHLLAYHLYTGPAEPVLRLARAQIGRGHQVELAFDTLRPGDMAQRAQEYSVPVNQRLTLSVKAGPIMLLRDVLELRRLWHQDAFEVLHAHLSHDHTLALLARPRRRHAVLIRTLHGENISGRGRRWLIENTDGIITTSQALRQKLLSQGMVREDNCLAIEGAVDTKKFFPDPNDWSLRQEIGVSPQVPLVGIVARMKEGRGHVELVRAWAEVIKQMPEAVLVLAGRGELEPKLRGLVEELRLKKNLLFIGYRTDLPSVYRNLDLKVILAPGRDGTCRAALEAMACGTPVLAFRRGALSEIIEEGRNGFLVESLEPAQLAHNIVRALADRAKLKEMGRLAAEQAPQRFSLKRQLEAVDQFYQLLFGRLTARGH